MPENDYESDLSDSSLSDPDSDYDSGGGNGGECEGESEGPVDDGWLVEELKKEKDLSKGGAPLTSWTPEVHKAYLRAIHLIPNLGVSRWPLGNQRVQRNNMISEYIARQTGMYRTAHQVGSHASFIRRAKNGPRPGLCRALQGHYVPHDELKKIDWDAFLGPDNYPNVKAAERRNAGWKVNNVKRKRSSSSTGIANKRTKVEPQLDSTFSKSLPVASSSTSRVASSWSAPSTYAPQGEVSSPSSRAPAATTPTHEPLPVTPSPSFQPFTPAAPPFSLSPTSHPFLADLTAFLTSFHPSRDHGPTARALLNLGIASPSALVLLLALESSSLELLYEHLRKKVGLAPLDVAWLKKAVGAAREGCARGE
ncbi:hypothetical protein JCM8208_002153 [Rhodotorula glutinis]